MVLIVAWAPAEQVIAYRGQGCDGRGVPGFVETARIIPVIQFQSQQNVNPISLDFNNLVLPSPEKPPLAGYPEPENHPITQGICSRESKRDFFLEKK